MQITAPMPLPRSFYNDSAAAVAPRLLGHLLLRRAPNGVWAGGPIVETEAYLVNDPACHGFRGETARNRSMYGPPGRAYVYFIYGNYWCFNAVCAPKGIAEAVLIRAIEPMFGDDWMLENRPVKKVEDLTSGPAKLCLALDLDRGHDGVDLCTAKTGLVIARHRSISNYLSSRGPVVTTTRIGITEAADLPLRFYLDEAKFVSKRQRVLRPRKA